MNWSIRSNEVCPDDDSALAAALALIAKTGPRRVWQGRCKRQLTMYLTCSVQLAVLSVTYLTFSDSGCKRHHQSRNNVCTAWAFDLSVQWFYCLQLCRLNIFSVDSWSNMTYIKKMRRMFFVSKWLLTSLLIKLRLRFRLMWYCWYFKLIFRQIGYKHCKYVNDKMERQNVAYTAPSTPRKRSHIYN